MTGSGMIADMAQKETRTYRDRLAHDQGSEKYRTLKRRSVAMPDELWALVEREAGDRGMSPWIRRIVAEELNRPDLGSDD